MSEHMMPIPSRVYNAAVGGHVAGADQIIDDETNLTLDKVAGGALEEKTYISGSNNGMGRVVLRKNLVEGVNTLTQSMINKSNTIYIIPYNFTLGENITVPVNCILEFDGGSVINATGNSYIITYNNTQLKGNINYSNVQCTGTLSNNKLYLIYYGDDDTHSLQELMSRDVAQGVTILLDHSITLTSNIAVHSNSQANTLSTIMGVGKGTAINTNGYHFYGTVNGSSGFLKFINILFIGPGRNTDTYMFAGDSLVRCYFLACFFKDYNSIITNGNGYQEHIQTIYFQGCFFRNVEWAINVHTLYDVRFNECAMEASNGLVQATAHINHLVIENSLIEGVSYVVKAGVHCEHLVVINSYFEENSVYNIDTTQTSGKVRLIYRNNYNANCTCCVGVSKLGVYENSYWIIKENCIIGSTVTNSDMHPSVTSLVHEEYNV